MKLFKWKYGPSGNCPIQAEGHFMKHYFYFRARHESAIIEFASTESAWQNDILNAQYTLWTTKERYSAGWLNFNFCKLLIYCGCIRFLFKRNKESIIIN